MLLRLAIVLLAFMLVFVIILLSSGQVDAAAFSIISAVGGVVVGVPLSIGAMLLMGRKGR